jgi:hypothetical protein
VSNITNKIGCQANGLKIVDPNNFDGQSSSSNFSVATEDLNISVVLRTKKKGRTVLTKEPDLGTRESTNNISINFIEGSTINGEKVLTTKYTDLTTVFDKGIINDETLGITNIDIDFNTAMVPMITINFVDVRGSSIFQNEENLAGNNSGNKYSTFFQMPYPIFELEIKGYYGKPVTYCLHMYKFNSKFNSKTGNFEIQCEFIGYTYAMLSDMLIGYLKAIPYTKIGAEIYENYKKNNSEPEKIITLVELMKKISDINKGVTKIANTSENAVAENSIKKGIDQLDVIENVINFLGGQLQYGHSIGADSAPSFEFIIKTSKPLSTDESKSIKLYQDNIKKAIDDFNGLKLDTVTLDVAMFQAITSVEQGKGFYSEITKQQLSDSSNTTIDEKLGSTADGIKLKKDLLDYMNANYSAIREDFLVDVYDMNQLYNKLREVRAKLETASTSVREELAKELKESARAELGFEPTVRNIIEIFTAAIEVFMETIYRVSSEAESLGNTGRIAQLKPKFSVDLVSSDIKKDYLDSDKFFAWPDYREKDEKKKTYVEKYLGSNGVLDNPKKVNELEFIDDLLAAFLKAAKDTAEVKANADAETTTWYSVNPLDTEIFTQDEPYSRTELIDNASVTRLMLIRGMTFLGYTNDEKFLTSDEIKTMGELEAEAIIRGVKNPNVKTSMTFVDLNFIKNITGTINNVEEKVILDKDIKTVVGLSETTIKKYVYNYIHGKQINKTTPVSVAIPISDSFTGEWPTTKDGLAQKANDGSLFLTNYSSNGNLEGKKGDDGGLYMKIIQKKDLPTTSMVSTASTIKKDNTMILSKLKSEDVDISAGYNTFGGTLGIQEYVNMDFGDQKGLPLMYVFYKDQIQGLSLNRAQTGIDQKIAKSAPTSSIYDYQKTGTILVMNKKKEKLYDGKNGEHLVGSLGKNRDLFKAFYVDSNTSISYPYIEQKFLTGGLFTDSTDSYSELTFSLFGSKWYYNQDEAKCIGQVKDGVLSINTTYNCSRYTKASLFLQTLPFNRVGSAGHSNPFSANEIVNLFSKKGGLIHVPRLWCAYIGSVLWRINDGETAIKYPIIENDLIVGGGSGKVDPFVWVRGKSSVDGVTITKKFTAPTRKQYFPDTLNTTDIEDDANYETISPYDLVVTLPQQIKDEFKKMFFDFVNGTDGMVSWDSIREKLEIWNGTSDAYWKFLDNIQKHEVFANGYPSFNASLISGNPNIKNTDSYNIITYTTNDGLFDSRDKHKDYLFLELKGDNTTNSAIGTLISALNQEVIIVNNNYKVWTPSNTYFNDNYVDISVSVDNFNLYFNSLIAKLKESASKYSPNEIKKDFEQSLFGTTNEDTIKLILYRNCKNIHDKWLAGVTDTDDIMYQCGGASGRSSVDAKLGSQYGNATPKFIDTFRFISRSFKDIGDELYINPIPINDYLIDGVNSGAYDAISSLLAANHFDFIALPNFINYRDNKEVESIFTPYGNYEKAKMGGSCGPAFVCVYAGEPSKHLDFQNSEYSNDGIDLRCVNGGVDMTRVPDDFTQDLKDFEDGLGVFTVKYSQQNQNIFKDIDLDQNEFTETNESLQIQEDISQKGSETNRTIAGQNIFNVYSVRSYTANVEMMGNAMIQPMMYFQLDNIPMFHGGYMITRVRHKIQPNNMTTSFTGVRTKFSATPLLTSLDLYMSMVDAIDTTAAGTGEVRLPKSVPPIVDTIIDNGGMPSNIVHGNITMKPIELVSGINNIVPKTNNILLGEAVAPLKEMLTEWVGWMKSNGFKGSNGVYANITSAFRTNEDQARIKKSYPNSASAGVSNHQWGIAVDFQFYKKDGSLIPNKPNVKSSFNVTESGNYALKWLLDNSYKYGWVLPYGLRNGEGSVEEHWHFEYHGTAAKCLMEKSPSTYGYTVKNFVDQKPSVTNPKTPKNVPDVYLNCNYVTVSNVGDGVEIELGSGADYWSLVSICCLESGFDQGRADVAQSIYNRLSTPKQPYGKSLKEIIIDGKQYEPTFRNKGQWRGIKDEKSALVAIMGSKNWNSVIAKRELDKTVAAIKNVGLQDNAISFVNTRTEFLANHPKSSKAISVVQRSPDSANNAFYWEYAGKSLINKTPSRPPDFSKLA